MLVIYLKRNAQFLFLCNPQKSSVNVYLMKIIKKHCTKKKWFCVFITLVKKIFKSSSFCNISNFHNDLFEIHQEFKGHFLNKLRVSFKFWKQKLVFAKVSNFIPGEKKNIDWKRIVISSITFTGSGHCFF